LKTCTCIISEERAPRKTGEHASKRLRIRLPSRSSSMAGYTDITDGKETGSRNRPLLFVL
ncbi:MAG: hypothetical protein WBX14_00500, partial [Candidatus Udaeobacter sp.]